MIAHIVRARMCDTDAGECVRACTGSCDLFESQRCASVHSVPCITQRRSQLAVALQSPWRRRTWQLNARARKTCIAACWKHETETVRILIFRTDRRCARMSVIKRPGAPAPSWVRIGAGTQRCRSARLLPASRRAKARCGVVQLTTLWQPRVDARTRIGKLYDF